MAKIHVLKPFTFTRRVSTGHKVPVERYFPKGWHEIDDETAAHPFISKYFADGCIETPAQAEARAKAAAETAAKAANEADQALLFAKQAYDRTVANARRDAAQKTTAPAPAPIPAAPAPKVAEPDPAAPAAAPAGQSIVYSAGAPAAAQAPATPAAVASTTLTTKQTAKK